MIATGMMTDHRLVVFLAPGDKDGAIVLGAMGEGWEEATPGARLSDECFEDGELRPPGPGLWVWTGTFRVEAAGWCGASWDEGGAYLSGSVGEEWGAYPSEWRRPDTGELHKVWSGEPLWPAEGEK